MRKTTRYMALPYNPHLKERARELRKAGNLSEVLLWNQLKKGQLFELDFDRQKIIGNYIVDFYCAEKGLVIEIDGVSHDSKEDYDAQRDDFLHSLGLRVVHVQDIDVKRNMAGIIQYIQAAINSPQSEGCPAGAGWLLQRNETTPSGFACHPSKGGEL